MDTQNITALSPTGEHGAEPANTTPSENDAAASKLLSEATKNTIFAAFILYALGFIVWRSFLGSYGVCSLTFLQAEYFSAALCYFNFGVVITH